MRAILSERCRLACRSGDTLAPAAYRAAGASCLTGPLLFKKVSALPRNGLQTRANGAHDVVDLEGL